MSPDFRGMSLDEGMRAWLSGRRLDVHFGNLPPFSEVRVHGTVPMANTLNSE